MDIFHLVITVFKDIAAKKTVFKDKIIISLIKTNQIVNFNGDCQNQIIGIECIWSQRS